MEAVHEVGDSDAREKYAIYDWDLQERPQAGVIHFHSPYPEVRAVTDAYDDLNMHCETFCVYVLGIVWTAVGVFINNFFFQRHTSIALNTSVVQLSLYPFEV